MSLSVDGNTIVFDGTVTITNATDLSSGVATMMLTPSGGAAILPFMAQGLPGLPPELDTVTVNQIPAGQTPAQPTFTKTVQGGPGVASQYNLTMEVNQGDTGPTGTVAISAAIDLSHAPTDQEILKFVTSTSLWTPVAELCGDTLNAVTFTSASGNTSPITLGSISVPAQPFDWRPDPKGFAIATGTANTHVDLRCLINNPTTGDQVGYGKGITGAGSTGIPAFPITLIQSFGSAIGTGSYGRIPKGSATTLYFQAVQTATTTDSWAIAAADCSFSVKIDPIPGTS